MKRLFEIVASGLGLICLSPLFVVLAVWIKCDSKGPVLYRQIRMGKYNRHFRPFKFRSMCPDSDRLGLIGGNDPRYSIDFPQIYKMFLYKEKKSGKIFLSKEQTIELCFKSLI